MELKAYDALYVLGIAAGVSALLYVVRPSIVMERDIHGRYKDEINFRAIATISAVIAVVVFIIIFALMKLHW